MAGHPADALRLCNGLCIDREVTPLLYGDPMEFCSQGVVRGELDVSVE